MLTMTRTTAPATAAGWPHLPAPGIKCNVPPIAHRAAASALRAVDRDIERAGSVTYETVEHVRATLALLNRL